MDDDINSSISEAPAVRFFHSLEDSLIRHLEYLPKVSLQRRRHADRRQAPPRNTHTPASVSIAVQVIQVARTRENRDTQELQRGHRTNAITSHISSMHTK